KGKRLKRIGQAARSDMERLFGSKVVVTPGVKVRSGWSDGERALRSLGYQD
ncbi:MAG: GTPase Era, partial [Gammaproteobacteria bacterium]